MSLRFGETACEQGERSLKLIGPDGKMIVELEGSEIDDAVRDGFIDPADYHVTLFEYARMIRELEPFSPVGRPADPPGKGDFDSDFLASIDIRWDPPGKGDFDSDFLASVDIRWD